MDRNQQLVALYSKCIESNYTDMSNETHQLKVKVFAMDLGLKYKRIEDLYNEAKTAYEQHQANQERNAILKKKQEEAKQCYYLFFFNVGGKNKEIMYKEYI